MLKIKVILGSTRQGRFGEQPANWILERAKEKGLDVELLDLRDYPLPFFDEAQTPSSKKEDYSNPVVAQWTVKIKEADGIIMTVAEYNHGYTAVLKNAIDYVGSEWNKKPVGFVAYGSVGGARAVEQLRLVLAELQVVTMRGTVHIVAPWTMFDEKGIVNMTPFNAAGDAMIDQLTWWGNALKEAKEKDAGAVSVV